MEYRRHGSAGMTLGDPHHDSSSVRPGAVVLITGAARGLGAETVRQFAGEGMRVIVAARNHSAAQALAGTVGGAEPLTVDLDIADAGSVKRAAAECSARWGRLDVLINNAAEHPDRDGTATGADLKAVATSFDTNLFGTWRMIQEFLPLLIASDHPRIVNVSSGAGSHADPEFGLAVSGGAAAVHGVSKAAVNALTAVLAAEFADSPIMINAVCPGFTATVPGAEALGARPVADSVPGIFWAATLPDDGPRGGFFRDGRPLGW